MRITSPGRHAIAALAVIGTGALALAGCSGGSTSGPSPLVSIPDEDPTATVHVLTVFDLEADNLQPVIDAFEEAHPTITIDWQTVPFDALNSTIDANVSNKQGDPDVYWADQPRISALAARGEAEDLTSAFSEFEEAFAPSAYQSGIYEGALYSLPIANSTQLLYYNKDLLAAAGVDLPSANVDERMTWEQLTADAKKVVAAGAENGLLFGQFDRYYQLEALPVSNGGSVGASGEGNLTPDFTSEEWVEALDWYGSLFAEGISPRAMTPDQTDSTFVGGQAAYMVEGQWLLPQLQGATFEWGVAPHPFFEGGDAATPTGSWSLAMNPFSKEKEAAAIFMRWMAVDDGGGIIKYRPNPDLPANVDGKAIYFQQELFTSDQGRDAATIMDYETSNTAVNRVSTIGYIEFETILNQAFSDIRNGADSETALTKAADDLTTAWAKYNK
jgi:ABC-type glycerol-3-phosphate transport system substrate-binding protein